MEKTIKFEDIIVFIEKAMEKNLNIETTIIKSWDNFSEIHIYIYDTDESCISIRHISRYNDLITITKNRLDCIDIEVSEIDTARFKVEVLKAQEYSKNKVIVYFNNFFAVEESKLTDINDLDNEED